MVSFVCDGCQDTVKKPKLAQHYQRYAFQILFALLVTPTEPIPDVLNPFRCRSAFTCVDCQTMFSGTSWESHSSCITEEQKTHGSLYRGPKNKVRHIFLPTPFISSATGIAALYRENCGIDVFCLFFNFFIRWRYSRTSRMATHNRSSNPTRRSLQTPRQPPRRRKRSRARSANVK